MSNNSFEKALKVTEKSLDLLAEYQHPQGLEKAQTPVPEVVSEEEVKHRLAMFQQSFYISEFDFGFEKVKVINSHFITVSKLKKSMAIGPRFTAALSSTGENLIAPDAITARTDIEAYYVKHEDGYAGVDSCFGDTIVLEKNDAWKDVETVEGEVYVKCDTGYEVLAISADQSETSIEYDGLEITLTEFGKHHILLSVTPENAYGYKIEAYDQEGNRLANSRARHPVYADGKLAADFNEQTLPESSNIDHYIYSYGFKGEIARAELYIPARMQTHWLPFKTPAVPKDNELEDYTTIGKGPSFNADIVKYEILSDEDTMAAIQCELASSAALLELNKAELTVMLPQTFNTDLAELQFEDVMVIEKLGAEAVELEYYRSARSIRSFTVPDEECIRRNLEVVPGETRFTGKAIVDYPAEIEWVTLTPANPCTADGHRVSFDGGLLAYTAPEGYQKLKMDSSLQAYFIKAMHKDGSQLRIRKVSDGPVVSIGVLGAVEEVQIAICRRWLRVEREFDLLADGDPEHNPSEHALEA